MRTCAEERFSLSCSEPNTRDRVKCCGWPHDRAAAFWTPSANSTPAVTSAMSVEPFNARHVLEALSISLNTFVEQAARGPGEQAKQRSDVRWVPYCEPDYSILSHFLATGSPDLAFGETAYLSGGRSTRFARVRPTTA